MGRERQLRGKRKAKDKGGQDKRAMEAAAKGGEGVMPRVSRILNYN